MNRGDEAALAVLKNAADELYAIVTKQTTSTVETLKEQQKCLQDLTDAVKRMDTNNDEMSEKVFSLLGSQAAAIEKIIGKIGGID